MTGSGKTKILYSLRALGEQMIDLEALAQHCGSTYGTLNRLIQPTQEQFENNFADRLKDKDPGRKIWIEDESISIGKRLIPKFFWDQMQRAPLFNLQVSLDRRIRELTAEYGIPGQRLSCGVYSKD